MSMPCIDLECEHCDFKGNDMVTWGRYTYVHGENEYNVNRCLGWCSDCSKLAPIEDFSDTDKVLKKLGELADELEKDAVKWGPIRLLKRLLCYKWNISEISQLTKRLNIIRLRKGSEKCLDCGSTGVKKFDGDYQLDYEGLLYRGEREQVFYILTVAVK